MIWTDAYIGIPKKDGGRTVEGVDCYGLVYLVYLQERGISLPTYEGEYMSGRERKQIDQLLNNAIVSSEWIAISDYKPFDIVAFRIGQFIHHVGLVVDHNYMLHVREDHAKIENYRTPQWASRLVGTYRYVG